MRPQDLIAAFDTLAEAPEGVTRLRELVLHLAVRGLLVDQNCEDEPASECLPMVSKDLAELQKRGNIKRHSLGEIPSTKDLGFVLPHGWAVARLSQIAAKISGNSKLIKGRLHSDPGAGRYQGFSAAGADVWLDHWEHEGCAIIVSAVGARCGKCFLATGKWSAVANTAIVWPFKSIVEPSYLMLLLNNEEFWARSGGAQPFVNFKKSFESVVVVPPLAEQPRIVARVDELMGLIDRLEAARNAREGTRASLRDAALAALQDADTPDEVEVAWKRIADRMDDLFTNPADVEPLRQTVLQLAVRGRLVPQDPEDEPANVLLERLADEKVRLVDEKKIRKPKSLPPVREDEVPFGVPDGWEWCRLAELASLVTKGSSPKWQGVVYVEPPAGILFVTSENVGAGRLLMSRRKHVEARFNEVEPRSVLAHGDLLLNIVGASIGRACKYDLDEVANINQAVCLIRPIMEQFGSSPDFVLTVLNSELARDQMFDKQVDMARANLSLGNVSNFTIPLPPPAEQHRIVAKVNELMGLLDRLEDRLVSMTAAHDAFAAAAVHHLDE